MTHRHLIDDDWIEPPPAEPEPELPPMRRKAGRPRKPGGPLTEAQRQERSRNRLLLSGGRILRIRLPPAVAAALDRIKREEGYKHDTKAAVRAILWYASRRNRPQK